MTKLKPLGNRVLLEAVKEEKKKGGIILPDTLEKGRPEKGIVLAVGPGKVDDNGKKIPMSIKKGDKVYFRKYSEDAIKVGSEEYLIVSEDNILAVE
jgi:chaperonin GroES